jgi:hypothetical protein
MNLNEFADYRRPLTRNVRTKIKQCKDEGCECILWVGALDSSSYGSFKLKGVVRIAHRYVYESLVGPIELPCATCADQEPRVAPGRAWDDWGNLGFCGACHGTGLDPDPTIDHLCTGHRNCMNVNHMEIVSRTENSIRANNRRHNEGYSRMEEPNDNL